MKGKKADFIGLNFASEPLKKVKDKSLHRTREAQRNRVSVTGLKKSLVMYLQPGCRKYTIRGSWENHERVPRGPLNMRNGIIMT